MKIPDIIKFMPELIKVVEIKTRKKAKISSVQLGVGDILEVLGTTDRCTRMGVQTFLR